MAKVMITLTVADFGQWKVGYEAGAEARRAAGWRGSQVFQSEENPNEIILIHEWDSEEEFKAFANSPTLKEAQKRAGVSKAEGYILKSVSE